MMTEMLRLQDEWTLSVQSLFAFVGVIAGTISSVIRDTTWVYEKHGVSGIMVVLLSKEERELRGLFTLGQCLLVVYRVQSVPNIIHCTFGTAENSHHI
jgi:hypothetical protein